jgi:hypothetical protein
VRWLLLVWLLAGCIRYPYKPASGVPCERRFSTVCYGKHCETREQPLPRECRGER